MPYSSLLPTAAALPSILFGARSSELFLQARRTRAVGGSEWSLTRVRVCWLSMRLSHFCVVVPRVSFSNNHDISTSSSKQQQQRRRKISTLTKQQCE
uniref:Secreted protein n=1 Tax=Trichogramma kaykai TaxID=54128 RepID=A0ABD2XG51_9HYME